MVPAAREGEGAGHNCQGTVGCGRCYKRPSVCAVETFKLLQAAMRIAGSTQACKHPHCWPAGGGRQPDASRSGVPCPKRLETETWLVAMAWMSAELTPRRGKVAALRWKRQDTCHG